MVIGRCYFELNEFSKFMESNSKSIYIFAVVIKSPKF